ncbi:hypothetical protein [Ligilactobacillus salivarius]|uniref:LPXTG cell wall anchor domain-containing protein n=1 Tax=Ligilactobacillus salivarius TaxID=1624 RepID=A0A9X6SA25_9LACO|nr:hypothetical protein [Ligilactobacillus salivarius]OTF89853.1 hypothetical protein A8C38_05875 [Ligilactobacillus salivarius]PAY27847.1 hypothetical protein A8C33_05350 [Ligilactobacillus salivarius]PAY29244.1 hypothetical protein A8C44_01975 [Ligilactobacillus salivarius]PAY30024.1 hypothetical protein A8C49_05325 [Ligilactobacillus salivarius]PAY36619.1 hypothetical protein A8C50_05125 [Ligilactobacillus salivarius]
MTDAVIKDTVVHEDQSNQNQSQDNAQKTSSQDSEQQGEVVALKDLGQTAQHTDTQSQEQEILPQTGVASPVPLYGVISSATLILCALALKFSEFIKESR